MWVLFLPRGLNTVIMNWKSTLVNHIACLRVKYLHQPDLPQVREAGSLSDKLVCHNSGPMRTKYGTGVPNRLCGNATPRVTTNPSTLYLGAGHSNTGGSIQTPPKAGHTDHRTSLGEGLLLQHFSGTQERWGPKTCDQPQSTQQLCSSRAFQDGGHSHSKGLAGTGRLVDKGRPQGHVFCNSNTLGTSEIPPVSVPGEELPFHMPLFRPQMSSMGIHQNPEASSIHSTADGCSDDRLHGRHTDHSRV